MDERRVHTISWKNMGLVFVIALAFLLPGNVVHANSLPPPSIVWFTFEYKTAQTPRLLGVQLVGCLAPDCGQFEVLEQYGICDGAGCVIIPAAQARPKSLDCAEDICCSVGYQGGASFRVIAQFSDRVRLSGVVSQLPSEYGQTDSWTVTVQEAALSIERGPQPPLSAPGGYLPDQPLVQFGLSILVEILVAGVCFLVLARSGIRLLGNRLLIVLLINLVSLAVVWFFFPTLGQFQTTKSQNLGFLVLIVAGVYTALLAGIYRSGHKIGDWLIVLAIVLIPEIGFCCFVSSSFMSGYSYDRHISLHGLPYSAVIIASEIFAVVYEAVMLTVLGKGSLSPKVAWITSLLMNAASFGLGLLLNTIWS